MKKPKKKINVGKELVKRTQDLNKNIESIMGQSANTKYKWNRKKNTIRNKQTFNIIGDTVTLTLSDNITFDLTDNCSNNYFLMDLDRETLKGMADFIYDYLDN